MARLVQLPDPAATALKGAFRIGRRVAQLARSGQPVRLLVAGNTPLDALLGLLGAEGEGFREALPWAVLEVVCEGEAALRHVEEQLLARGARPGLGLRVRAEEGDDFHLALLALDATGVVPVPRTVIARADEVWAIVTGAGRAEETARLFADMESWECGSEPTLVADAAATSRIDPALIGREGCRSDVCLRVVA